jgi:hypothetical protein
MSVAYALRPSACSTIQRTACLRGVELVTTMKCSSEKR